jgi:HAD superfamily hydrolase (TIGR01509 family)
VQTTRRAAAVLWDMDGTLVDSEKLWDIALREGARLLGGTLSEATRLQMVGTHAAATFELLFAEVGVAPTAERVAEMDAWLRRRMAQLLSDAPAWRPGAADALRAVRDSGVPTALVTSTVRELAEVALDGIGREHFDVTVCGDEVNGRNKPDPAPYLRAARLLGVDPRRCVAVEDSPTGVASAAAAGCVTVVVPHEVAVPAGERRIFRESLAGFDLSAVAV